MQCYRIDDAEHVAEGRRGFLLVERASVHRYIMQDRGCGDCVCVFGRCHEI
jgi:hypothetical protein